MFITSFNFNRLVFSTLYIYPGLQLSSLAAAATLRCLSKASQTLLTGISKGLRPRPFTNTGLPQCEHLTIIIICFHSRYLIGLAYRNFDSRFLSFYRAVVAPNKMYHEIEIPYPYPIDRVAGGSLPRTFLCLVSGIGCAILTPSIVCSDTMHCVILPPWM